MAGTDQSKLTDRLLSRRSMLAGGAAVAGAVWVAPAIESIGTAASATPHSQPPGPAFSYVTLLVKSSDGTYYRFKYGNFPNTPPKNGTCAPLVAPSSSDTIGSSFADGFCFSKDGSDPTSPEGLDISSSYPNGLTAQYCADSSGRLSFQISNASTTDFTLTAWVVHQGRCCASGTATTSTQTAYSTPTGNLMGKGSTLVFLAPGNGPTCS